MESGLRIRDKEYTARLIYEHEWSEAGLLVRLYEAWDTRLQRQVALKEISLTDSASPKGAELLDVARREARLLAQVGEHPNLPLLYDIKEEERRIWLEMEFVRGVNLGELYVRPGVMPSAREDVLGILDIALDVGRALQALHRRGIAHRDVSPANIVVGKRTKLIDLGLAVQPIRQAYRAEGEGTVGYRAPEQTAAREALSLPGPASDVYGLAAVLYHLLTATPPPLPLPGRLFLQPSQINPVLPPELDNILAAALALNPKERPRIGQFIQQLRKVRDDLRRTTVATPLAEHYNEGVTEPPVPPEPPPFPWSPPISFPSPAEQARARQIVLIGAGVLVAVIVLLVILLALR